MWLFATPVGVAICSQLASSHMLLQCQWAASTCHLTPIRLSLQPLALVVEMDGAMSAYHALGRAQTRMAKLIVSQFTNDFTNRSDVSTVNEFGGTIQTVNLVRHQNSPQVFV